MAQQMEIATRQHEATKAELELQQVAEGALKRLESQHTNLLAKCDMEVSACLVHG
jgi:hypothetical protein